MLAKEQEQAPAGRLCNWSHTPAGRSRFDHLVGMKPLAFTRHQQHQVSPADLDIPGSRHASRWGRLQSHLQSSPAFSPMLCMDGARPPSPDLLPRSCRPSRIAEHGGRCLLSASLLREAHPPVVASRSRYRCWASSTALGGREAPACRLLVTPEIATMIRLLTLSTCDMQGGARPSALWGTTTRCQACLRCSGA